MKDYTEARYYAISGIGYGKGFSPEEAVENYYATQSVNFKHLHRTRKGRIEVIRKNAPCEVWEAPEGVEGFRIDHLGLHWEDAEGNYTPATEDQRIE